MFKKLITDGSPGKMPQLPVSQNSMSWNKTGEWDGLKPAFENRLPPCNHACPCSEDVQEYVGLTIRRQFREAYDLIRETNPFPATCGRVCHHPCEANCNRHEFDEAVSIHNIERFIGDWGLKNVKTRAVEHDPGKGALAIIGSGPAGLSAAWQLANLGYQVTVFEALHRSGGMLRIGIPEYRLPRRILDSEIHSLLDRGIELRLGVRVGNGFGFEKLDPFRAVLIAVGAHQPRQLGIPGESKPGVQSGIRFLAEVNSGRRAKIDGEVAVIGGGDVAIHSARGALRLGGKPTIYFRRSPHEMPAVPGIVDAARQEGIEIRCLTTPLAIRRSASFLKLRLRTVSADAKRRSGAPTETEYEVAVTHVIIAMGEDPELAFVPDFVQRGQGGIRTGGIYQSNVDHIFAVGDCTEDRHSVCHAIASGRLGALAVDRYLRGEQIFVELDNQTAARFSDLNPAYFVHSQSMSGKIMVDNRRRTSFAEVDVGIAEPEAEREASRCLSCGVCNACDNCWLYCPDMAISRKDGIYSVNYDYCKGCGICVRECPHNAVHLREMTGTT